METTGETAPPETEAVLTVHPIPQTIDLTNLTDAQLHISFDEGDVYLDDTGILRMDATVYAYDRYEPADIARLQVGDTILLRGEPLLIQSLECVDCVGGDVTINGGLEQGGCWLIADDEGLYYEIGFSDLKSFYPLGQVTLRISGDFQYTDRSDLDAEPRVWYPGDFLLEDVGIDYYFTPHNTAIRLEDGQITQMERIYTP